MKRLKRREAVTKGAARDKRVISVLKLNGVEYTETSVVVSGRIVTANGPEAAKTFAEQVLEVLKKN